MQSNQDPPTCAFVKKFWRSIENRPAARTALVALGLFIMAASPALGILPGPGGIIVFAAGLTLVLKYSGWAKRLYVRFKRNNPKKGAWADWGLRRQSARRRIEREKMETGREAVGND